MKRFNLGVFLRKMGAFWKASEKAANMRLSHACIRNRAPSRTCFSEAFQNAPIFLKKTPKLKRNILRSVVVVGMLSGCGAGDFWRALKENQQGVKAIEDKNLAGAEEHFIHGLSGTPFLSQLHHNLGFTLEAEKKTEDALRSYKNAESLARTPIDLFAARFNLGAVHGQMKKIDEALFWYQKALEVAPDSVEVKTNIELLIKDQQQQGKGGGDGDDQQKDQDKKDQDKKDQKDQKDKDDKKDDKKDPKDGKDQEKKQPPNPQGDAKYKPRPFKGELGENEVKKILGEIKQQEQRIRAEYNRKEMKERPRDKDW